MGLDTLSVRFQTRGLATGYWQGLHRRTMASPSLSFGYQQCSLAPCLCLSDYSGMDSVPTQRRTGLYRILGWWSFQLDLCSVSKLCRPTSLTATGGLQLVLLQLQSSLDRSRGLRCLLHRQLCMMTWVLAGELPCWHSLVLV